MLIIELIRWWYGAGVRGFLGRLQLQIVKAVDFFSVGMLLQTLFTPFRLIDANPNYGESLDAKMRAGVDKLTARLIGGMIRMTMVVIGLGAILMMLVISAVRLMMWLAMPLLPIVGAILFAMEWRWVV